MISKIGIFVEEKGIKNLPFIFSYYEKNPIYKNTSFVLYIHEYFKNDKKVNDLTENKNVVYCNENNLFLILSSQFKNEENYCAFSFPYFLFGNLNLQNEFLFSKKEKYFYEFCIGSQFFWNKIFNVISKCHDNFYFIKNNSSIGLFSFVVDNFIKNGVDLKNEIYSVEKEEDCFNLNKTIFDIQKL